MRRGCPAWPPTSARFPSTAPHGSRQLSTLGARCGCLRGPMARYRFTRWPHVAPTPRARCPWAQWRGCQATRLSPLWGGRLTLSPCGPPPRAAWGRSTSWVATPIKCGRFRSCLQTCGRTSCSPRRGPLAAATALERARVQQGRAFTGPPSPRRAPLLRCSLRARGRTSRCQTAGGRTCWTALRGRP